MVMDGDGDVDECKEKKKKKTRGPLTGGSGLRCRWMG